jgi:hypothetical protein
MRPTHLVTLPLLCVLLPLLAQAQAPEPGSAQATPPPLISAPEEPEPPRGELLPREHTPGDEPQDSQRVLTQLLGGTAASAGTLLLVYGLYSLDSQSCDGFFCNPSLFFFGLGLGSVGLTVGPPLAIWLIGKHFDDRGRFWPSLVGGSIGTLGSVLSLTLILYELTRAPASSGPRVLPMVSLSRQGSIVGGLAGSF